MMVLQSTSDDFGGRSTPPIYEDNDRVIRFNIAISLVVVRALSLIATLRINDEPFAQPMIRDFNSLIQ
jgi:hypothetical protein